MLNSILCKKCIFIFSIIFLMACSKSNNATNLIANNKVLTNETLAMESFEALNNAIVRFDPLYLQVIYKDKRTLIQIQQQSTALIIEINKNPNNIHAQI